MNKENGKSWGTGINNRKFERNHPQRFGVQKGFGKYSGRVQMTVQPVAVRA